MKANIRNKVISHHLKYLNYKIEYYKSKPTAEVELWSAKEERRYYLELSDDAKVDTLKHYMLANYLRKTAIEARQTADDFKHNPFLKIRMIRECVESIHELLNVYPQLRIYSNHWLSSKETVVI